MRLDNSLSEEYDRIFRMSRDALTVGLVTPDTIPEHGSWRWGVSLIFRLPTGLSKPLVDQAVEVANLAGSEHIYYQPEDLHMTVRTLEPFRKLLSLDDDCLSRYNRAINGVCRLVPPFKIEYRGLTASGQSILVQGWPEGDRLMDLRIQLHYALADEGLAFPPEDEPRRIRRTAHTSICVLTGTLIAPQRLVDLITRRRHHIYGWTTVSQLEVVYFIRTADRAVPVTLWSTPLGGAVPMREVQ
jgi:hypothetical protein